MSKAGSTVSRWMYIKYSFICKNKALKYLQFSQQMLYIVNPEFKSLIMKSSPGNSIHPFCSLAVQELFKNVRSIMFPCYTAFQET